MHTICEAAFEQVAVSYAIRWQLLTKIYVGKLTLKEVAKEFSLDEHAAATTSRFAVGSVAVSPRRA